MNVEVRLFAQVGEGVGDSTWKCLRSSVGHHPPPLPPCVYLHITANGFLLPFWLCGSENIYTGRLKVLRFSVGHPPSYVYLHINGFLPPFWILQALKTGCGLGTRLNH